MNRFASSIGNPTNLSVHTFSSKARHPLIMQMRTFDLDATQRLPSHSSSRWGYDHGDGSDTFSVERSMMIDSPPARIYDQITNFHNWTNCSPWEDTEPEPHRTYSGAESGTGAIYGWSGNRTAGQGRMEITGATEAAGVQIDLVFEKTWKARNDTLFTIAPEGSGSRVTWSITGKNSLMDQGDGHLQNRWTTFSGRTSRGVWPD